MIDYTVLGDIDGDNALWVRLDWGRGQARLLFDCGEHTLQHIPFPEVYALDHIFFSHLHMDHIAGFDGLFRQLYARENRPNQLWGPPGSSSILQHRLQGFAWNLHAESAVSWTVHDLSESGTRSSDYRLGESFARRHDLGSVAHGGTFLETPHYHIQVLEMDHRLTSLAYVVREAPRRNVRPEALRALGVAGGPWLAALKAETLTQALLEAAGIEHPLEALREQLLETTPGDSVAYLTDFLLDEAAHRKLLPALEGVGTLVCECQYQAADAELAQRNHHMTSTQVAELARAAGVRDLVLMHVSDRYDRAGWRQILEEVRQIFPAARYPEGWMNTLDA